jgi:hypothetical protein
MLLTTDDLQQKVAKAHKAGVSAKLISKYLRIPLREVERLVKEEELQQWQALMTSSYTNEQRS